MPRRGSFSLALGADPGRAPLLTTMRRSLISRTILPLGLLLIALTTLAAIGIARKDDMTARNALRTKATLIASITARGIAASVWNLDAPQTEASLAALSSDPDYVGSEIIDPDKKIFARHGATNVNDGDLIIENVPIYQTDHGVRLQVGTLVLRMSTARSDREIAHQTVITLLLGLATMVVVCTLLIVIVRGTSGPIVAMTLATTRLAQGDTTVEIHAEDRIDEIGDMARALLVLRDHEMERHRLFQMQSRHLEIIEQEVEKRTAELQEALNHLNRTKDELVNSEKLAALGGMVAAIAHEVNTPIGGVLMVSTTLIERLKTFEASIADGTLRKSAVADMARGTSEGLELIVNGITRAAQLIRSFKQVAVDRTSDRRLSFSLRQLVEDVTATLRIKYKPRRVGILIDVPADLMLEGYPGSLGQVITNLVENAFIHGFPEGASGTLSLIAREADADHYEFIVEDDGIGIPAEHLKRIFEPFFTTRLGQGGSGLGLHIVYTLITGIHGGTISVASTRETGTSTEHGTQFRIVAPKSAPIRHDAEPEGNFSI